VGTPIDSNVHWANSSRAGVIACGFDTNAIREALVYATEDRERRSTLSENARIWSKTEGSWSRSEKALIDLYCDLSRKS